MVAIANIASLGGPQMMTGSGESGYLKGLIRDILSSSKPDAATPSLRDATKFFSSVSRLDYAAALAKRFDRRQLHEIFSELRRFLPALNQQVFRETDLPRLKKVAATLGAVLQARAFGDPKARTLRGFYVNDGTLLKEPLICVNTEDHPVGVAATFWHEMGHHLTHQIFGGHQPRLNPSFGTNYQDHLRHPEEIAADLVMILGCYPKLTAERLFSSRQSDAVDRDVDLLVCKARRYVRAVSGFDFAARVSGRENLNILAGMIHVARLRVVLLREYGI